MNRDTEVASLPACQLWTVEISYCTLRISFAKNWTDELAVLTKLDFFLNVEAKRLGILQAPYTDSGAFNSDT
eukprot:1380024-Pyramimonas_sp.AAC.2